jgi:streptomycin 6-kinase
MILNREGEAARDWLEALPYTVGDLLDRWRLRQEGPSMYGMCAVVLPVHCEDGKRGALKVSWVDDETRLESVALRTWSGHGAVTVLRTDEVSGAMLLERLDERRVLLDVPIQEALDTAAALLRELRVPAPAGFRSVGDIAARWGTEFFEDWRRLGKPCPEKLISSAVDVCAELAVLASEPSLLHGDFHYANILGRGKDSWAAIDPKPLKGDPAYEVVPLLRNRWSEIRGDDETNATVRQRVERFAEMAELEPMTVCRWCLVRSVDDAMWFQEHGYEARAEISWDIARSMLAGA